MVATRRTAPTGADAEMPDPELALKKKPVHKAATKTGAKAEAAPKAKAARGKKVVPAQDETAEQEPAPPPKTRARGRPKKTVEIAAVPEPELESEQPVKPAKAAKGTRTGLGRAKKSVVAVEEAPELPAPPEAKPARTTRAAASKAPLSPKKITQVTKPQTRNTKTTEKKPAAKAAATKRSVRGRVATRGRKVSDENADVPELAHPVEEDDSVAVVSSTPVKKPATRRQAAKKQADESEYSMSTRETTPTASPVQNQEHDVESEVEEPSVNLSTPGQQAETNENNDSDDELCGPKTPMRRGSPGAEARYHSSAQRTIRRYNEEQRMQTPARRYAVLGSQRGTPQTQRPYCRPTAPSSEVRPMTVARGANRAFVFKDLLEGVPELHRPQMQQASVAEEEDLSFIPDDNIIAMDDDEQYAQLTTPRGPAPLQLVSPPTSSTDIEEEHGEEHDIESLYDQTSEPQHVDQGNESHAMEEDVDATVVTEDFHEEIETEGTSERDKSREPTEVESFETEDTVIIHRPEETSVGDVTMASVYDESEASVVNGEPADSTPETMVWENVHPENSISVNFDEHLSHSRTLPEPESTEVLDVSAKIDDYAQNDGEIGAATGTHAISVQDSEEMNDGRDPILPQEPAMATQTPTVDLNAYFDMAALAEPTQAIDFAQPPKDTVDMAMAGAASGREQGESEEDAECPANDDFLTIGITSDGLGTTSDTSDNFTEGDDAIVDDSLENVAVGRNNKLEMPHYAKSTFAFDARRKSLPATSMLTPVRLDTRPNTSDGASIPRMTNPFSQAWWARSRANSTVNTPCMTPFKARQISPHGAQKSGVATPSQATIQGLEERYPIFTARRSDVDHSQSVAPPARFQKHETNPADRRKTFHRAVSGKTQQASTPMKTSTPTKVGTPLATPKERYPALGSRTNYVDHAQTVAPPARFQDHAENLANRRQTFHRAISGKTAELSVASLPAHQPQQADVTPEPQQTPVERFPRRRPRADNADHAKTVAAPRFQTPVKSPVKRPATTQKPSWMRKAALHNSATTPMKTPLKAPAMTPGQEPMTPHPAAPLRGVVALVEVYTLEGASASSPFTALLHRLGAKTTRAWTDRVTHVIFKDGSPTTLQRVRLHNKDVAASGQGMHVFCVNSRWVSDCDTAGAREDEDDEAYAVDVEEVPRGGKRRRKSMEPSILMNVGGNIVRDRKSSLGRSSSGRSNIRFSESPAKKAKLEGEIGADATPGAQVEDKENSDEEPSTPAWIAQPDKLVQMTAPMKRVRKMEPEGKQSRRLTFWDGGI